jgi:hypothetical protein
VNTDIVERAYTRAAPTPDAMLALMENWLVPSPASVLPGMLLHYTCSGKMPPLLSVMVTEHSVCH